MGVKNGRKPQLTYVWKDSIFIGEFSSQKEASDFIGCHIGSISKVIKGERNNVNGYWCTLNKDATPAPKKEKVVKLPKIKVVKPKKEKPNVYVWKDGILVGVYATRNEASEATGVLIPFISLSINKNEISKGYWFTLDENKQPPAPKQPKTPKVKPPKPFKVKVAKPKKEKAPKPPKIKVIKPKKERVVKLPKIKVVKPKKEKVVKPPKQPKIQLPKPIIYIWKGGALVAQCGSQKEAAEMVGCHNASISRMLNGKRNTTNNYWCTLDKDAIPPAPKAPKAPKQPKAPKPKPLKKEKRVSKRSCFYSFKKKSTPKKEKVVKPKKNFYLWKDGVMVGEFSSFADVADLIGCSLSNVRYSFRDKRTFFGSHFLTDDDKYVQKWVSIPEKLKTFTPINDKGKTIYIYDRGVFVGCVKGAVNAAALLGISIHTIHVAIVQERTMDGRYFLTYNENTLPPSRTTNELLEVEHEILTHYADKLGLNNVFELLDVIKKNSTIITTENDEQANRIELQDVYGDDQNFVTNDEEHWRKYLCGKWHV